MAEKVQQAIADVRLVYPNANPLIVLDLLNSVHTDLCADWPIERVTEDIELAEGTAEYEIPDGVLFVRSARYYSDADSVYVLPAVSADDLDVTDPEWRTADSATVPIGFYIDGGYIGLYPPPDTTSVDGYPNLTIEGCKCTPLTFDGDLPSSIKNRKVYTTGAKMLYAETSDKENYSLYRKLHTEERNNMERVMGRRNRRYKPQIIPDGPGYMVQQI